MKKFFHIINNLLISLSFTFQHLFAYASPLDRDIMDAVKVLHQVRKEEKARHKLLKLYSQ